MSSQGLARLLTMSTCGTGMICIEIFGITITGPALVVLGGIAIVGGAGYGICHLASKSYDKIDIETPKGKVRLERS